jgi:2-polyprenyl-6-methoxyphenol hydroxylase-like FAD-dependent oxidoreductase
MTRDAGRAMSDRSVPVAIVGAGPVGLALSLGLARHGVASILLERADGTSQHSKAAGIHIRTREVLGRWGVTDRFLAAGRLVTEVTLHDVTGDDRPLLSFDLSALADEADRPGLLVLEQSQTERLLLEAVRDAGCCEVSFGTEVVGLRAHDDHLELRVVREGGVEEPIIASYVVGCDGAGSFVREALGLPFEGRTYRSEPMLADVALDDPRDGLPWPRVADGGGGFTVGIRLRPGLWRIIHLDARSEGDDGEVADQEVQRRVDAVLGAGPVDVVWSSRFRIHRRASPRFRQGRVLLAGDAAHVHSPVGGQGMNAGIQDAADLAWKLAAALGGGDADRLLASYEAERRAVVVGSVSAFTDVVTRVYLQVPAWVRRLVFGFQRTALRLPALHRAALRRLSMIDLTLPGSPLLDARQRAAGRRLPDPWIRAPDGAVLRLHELLPVGAALLEVTSEEGTSRVDLEHLDVERVLRFGPGEHQDPSGMLRRLLGGSDGWLLVRPDGYLSWARTRGDDLPAAVRRSLASSRPAASR